jgi:hypothetical protein
MFTASSKPRARARSLLMKFVNRPSGSMIGPPEVAGLPT